MAAVRAGLVGCGNISDIYLTNTPKFRDIAFTAVSDIRPEIAREKAARYGLSDRSVPDLLASHDIDIVVNLTVPAAHAEVSLAALEAGKHVYCEKPLATTLRDGQAVVDFAAKRGLRVGCAPDTILGAGIQKARAIIDSGALGTINSATAAVLSRGMEHWHPNPAFFFQPGGGPVLDLGPYYIAALTTLLGPVERVSARGRIGLAERLVTAPGPNRGQRIKVEALTTVNALLTFRSGAEVVFLASWDVWRHSLPPIEIHGTDASLCVPDPNWFGGVVSLSQSGAEWHAYDTSADTYGVPNFTWDGVGYANYRALGLADMASAILQHRPHRCSGVFALHTAAVLLAILESATEDRVVTIDAAFQDPSPLSADEAKGLLAVSAPFDESFAPQKPSETVKA